MFFNTNKEEIHLIFDFNNLDEFKILDNEKTISFHLESVSDIVFQKKINYKSLAYFCCAELVFYSLTTHYFTQHLPLLFLLGIIRFLLFSEVFYVPIFEVQLTINTTKHFFYFSDEAVFVDFLLLKKYYTQKTKDNPLILGAPNSKSIFKTKQLPLQSKNC
jgi:hypothetical protein